MARLNVRINVFSTLVTVLVFRYIYDEIGISFFFIVIVIIVSLVSATVSKNKKQRVSQNTTIGLREKSNLQNRLATVPKNSKTTRMLNPGNNVTIYEALDSIPQSILTRSGSVFYSSPTAFAKSSRLYVLGLNPGGSPSLQMAETVSASLNAWRRVDYPWSAYIDESWEGKPPGSHGLQPRIKHLFDRIGEDLRVTPASNVVFVRSSTESELSAEKRQLLAECWPVHSAVIQNLNIDTIICLGSTAGKWVREALGAHALFLRWNEKNERGWTSEAHIAPDGRAVITLTHPGRADWRNPKSDPSTLVLSVLSRPRL